jgi:hypothetical protein
MMANPWEFLYWWARENVQPTVYDDKATAEVLAFQVRQEAKGAGVSEASVVKAAGGNLESFMLSRLNDAVNAEVDRLASKDRR